MSSDAEEIERIKQKKLAEMMGTGAANADAPGSPVPVTDDDFEAFVKKHPKVVVDCWAPWCGPCRMLSPTIDQLAAEMKGEVVFGKLNTDDNIRTSGKYRIASIPTLLLFKEGKLVDRMIGAAPKVMVEQGIKKALG